MSEFSVLINQLATGEADEKVEALKEIDSLPSLSTYYPYLVSELENEDSRVRFWCLDLLIKKLPFLLYTDSKNVIPVLIKKLTNNNHPIIDRAIWALSITGADSVNYLIEAIETTPSTDAKSVYIHALGKNTNVHLQAERVITLFSHLLSGQDAEIRFSAMIAFMDLSPLRPWFDKKITGIDFKSIYREVTKVATEFKSNFNHYSDLYVKWATMYLDLIERQEIDDY
jgi:HEAT repeat protein